MVNGFDKVMLMPLKGEEVTGSFGRGGDISFIACNLSPKAFIKKATLLSLLYASFNYCASYKKVEFILFI